MYASTKFLLACLSLSGLGVMARPARDAHGHEDDVVLGSVLPGPWYQDQDHPAHALFRRQDGGGASQVGSPTWSSAYPSSTPDPSKNPQAWTDALNAAVQAGKIPDLAPSKQANPDDNPTYDGKDPNDASVCSATYQCRSQYQVWDAPDGTIGLGFDDGPLEPSDTLYSFLRNNSLHATHFFIGVNIVEFWESFLVAYQTNGDDLAVHTWTHPYMTTLSNEDVLAQLGWTMQIIYDSTGGKIPAYWRPPYGDTDVRVTAIAKEVFGMTAVIWNHDSEDWTLGDGSSDAATPASIQTNFQKWVSGSKSPGLIVLEHELSDASVQAFMSAYPLMTQNDWTLTSIARINGSAWQSNGGSVGNSSANSTFPLPGNNDGSSFPSSVAANASASATATASASSHSASSTASAGNGTSSAQQNTSGASSLVNPMTTIPWSIVIAAVGLLAGVVVV